MTNMYETWLMEQIHSIANFPYEDIKILDKYPLDVSKQVLKVLIENSCLGQNYGPIDISRKKINEINKDFFLRLRARVLIVQMNGNIDD